MRTVVISDVHGNWESLQDILTKSEVVQNGTKQPNTRVIFVGDIVDLGASNTPDNDLKAAELAVSVGDDFIVGNHEFPFLFPPFYSAMYFGGIRGEAEVAPVLNAFPGAIWQLATDANGWLITHAGLHPEWGLTGTAAEIADLIADRFGDMLIERSPDPLFTGIDWMRGGRDRIGGIVWLDARSLQEATEDRNPIPQIVGHTANRGNPANVFGNWFIDPGKGSVACLVSDDGADWIPFLSRKA